MPEIVGIALIGASPCAVAVAVVRRELRIRRRLADTHGTRPAPHRADGAPATQVGRPPTRRRGRAPAAAPTDPGTCSSVSPPVAAAGRLGAPTGGVA